MRRLVVLVACSLLVPLAGVACSLAIPFGDYDALATADASDVTSSVDATRSIDASGATDATSATDAGRPGEAASAVDAADAMDAYDGLSYVAVVDNDSPIAYLRLDDEPGSTVPTVRYIILDDAGYGTGVTFGVTGALAHDSNKAISVDGTSFAVDLTSNDAFSFAGNAPYTVEVWCKPDAQAVMSDPGAYYELWGRNEPSATDRVAYVAGVLGTSFYADRIVAGTDGYIQDITDLTEDGEWSHVVVTYDGSNHDLYVNGVLAAPGVADAGLDFAAPVDLIIGGRPQDGAGDQKSFFVGALDELAIYDHPLTASHILLHYEVGTGAPVQVDP